MDEISFHMNNVEVPDLNPEFLRLWVKHIIESHNGEVGELTYIFCSDEYLLEINKQYLRHDYYTDIITFNYNEGNTISGDIFISVDMVKHNAEKFAEGKFDEELNRVIAHGVLHLCGFNDKTKDEQILMTKKEDWALQERARFT